MSEEHRVVYRAVADFSALMVEAAKARAELRSLAAEKVTAKVQVKANVAETRTELKRVFDAITAKVKVAIDAVSARAEVKRVFADLTGKLKVKVSVSAVQARAEVKELDGLTAKLGVKLDTRTAVAEMRALIAKLQAMGPVKLQVGVDRSTLPRIPSGAAPRSGGGIGGDFGGSGMRLGGVPLQVLMPVAVALIPVVAVLAAGVGVLTSALVAAAGAASVFALAAVGHFAAVKKAMEESAESGVPLTGAMGDVAAGVGRVKAAWTDFLSATETPVFAVFADALQLVVGLLPRLVGLANAAAGAIRGALGEVTASLDGEGFGRFLNFLTTSGPTAIVSFTRSLINIGAGLGEMAMAFAPFIASFLGGMEKMTASFTRWAASLSGSERFQAFMDYAARTAPLVLDVIAQLFLALVNVGEALAPVGVALLVVVDGFARLVAAVDPALLLALAVAAGGIAIALKATAIAAWLAVAAARAYSIAVAIAAVVTDAATGGITAIIKILAVALIALGAAIVGAYYKFGPFRDAVDGVARVIRDQLLKAWNDLVAAFRANVLPELKRSLDAIKTTIAENKQLFHDLGLVAGVLAFAFVALLKLDLQILFRGIAAGARLVTLTFQNVALMADVMATNLHRMLGLLQGIIDVGAKLPGAAGAPFRAMKGALDGAEKSLNALDFGKAVRGFTDTGDAAEQGFGKAEDAATSLAAALRKTLAEPSAAAQAVAPALAALQTWKDAVLASNEAKQRQKDVSRDTNRAIVDAEHSAAQAHRSTMDAQKALTQARIDAAAKLEDYQRKLRDIPDTEEGARISLERAKENIRRVQADPNSTVLDRRQAILDLKDAKDSLSDLLGDNAKTRREAEEAQRKGVEGSPEVVAAKRALADAVHSEAQAHRAVTDAQRDGRKANAEAAAAVKDLGEKAALARLALDQQALATGRTTAELSDLKKKMDEGDWALQVKLSTLDPNDVVGRLKAVALHLEAIRLLQADPTHKLSLADALKMAGNIVNTVSSKKGKNRPALATGGRIDGPGTGTSDDVPAWLSAGEHVWTAAEVMAAGGHVMVERLRKAVLAHPLDDPTRRGIALALGGAVPRMSVGGRPTVALDVTGRHGITPGALLPRFHLGGPVPTSYAGGGAVSAVRLAAGGAVSGGLSTGDINIYNPVPEPAGESMYRTVRKLAFEYDR